MYYTTGFGDPFKLFKCADGFGDVLQDSVGVGDVEGSVGEG